MMNIYRTTYYALLVLTDCLFVCLSVRPSLYLSSKYLKDLNVEEARVRLIALVQRYFIDVAQHKVLLIHAALDHDNQSTGTKDVIQKTSVKAGASVSVGGKGKGSAGTAMKVVAALTEESSSSMVVDGSNNGSRTSGSGSVTTVLREVKEVHDLGTVVVQSR